MALVGVTFFSGLSWGPILISFPKPQPPEGLVLCLLPRD